MVNLQHILELVRTGRALREADLRGLELSDSDLSGLRADGVDLSRARLDRALLCNARFSGCKLGGASLEEADASDATLRDCAFDAARLSGARLVQARFEDCSAEGADFTGADLSSAHLTETVLTRATLQRATLDDAEGQGIVLRGADLRGASLRRVKMIGADFRGADLTGADLTGAVLGHADFRGAILNDVVWDAASHSGARFDIGVSVPQAAATPGFEASASSDGGATEARSAFEEFLRGMVADPRLKDFVERVGHLGTGAPESPRGLLDALRVELAARGADVSEQLRPFEAMLDVLESAPDDQPPAEWKPWLERIMASPPPELAKVLACVDAASSGRKPRAN
jgi:uncharacterized protein YjbI with pentapeptide repeats